MTNIELPSLTGDGRSEIKSWHVCWPVEVLEWTPNVTLHRFVFLLLHLHAFDHTPMPVASSLLLLILQTYIWFINITITILQFLIANSVGSVARSSLRSCRTRFVRAFACRRVSSHVFVTLRPPCFRMPSYCLSLHSCITALTEVPGPTDLLASNRTSWGILPQTGGTPPVPRGRANPSSTS
jgi:hypothetical protein